MSDRTPRPTSLHPSNGASGGATGSSNASHNASHDGAAPPTDTLRVVGAIAPTDVSHSTASTVPQLVRQGGVGELMLVLPDDVESRGARVWLWEIDERLVRCTVCVHCGGRVETLVTPSLSDVLSATASPRHTCFHQDTLRAVQAFVASHAACTGDIFDSIPYGCPESTWDVPTAVVAAVRYWVDDVLDDRLVARAIEGPWARGLTPSPGGRTGRSCIAPGGWTSRPSACPWIGSAGGREASGPRPPLREQSSWQP